MLKTRFTEMMGIRLPVMQGGMQWIARAELAAAVSNAGGLGCISAMCFDDTEALRAEIRRVKALTDAPFAVNLSMLPSVALSGQTADFAKVIAEEHAPAVETSGRSPGELIPLFKEAGVKIIHKVPAVRFAQKAQELGVDAVTLVGFECGGHPGMDDVPTAILVQRASQCLQIPILAAGGIMDGRGLAAARCWGADGVVMGTRFLLTKECDIHQNVKDWMASATERDTMVVQRSIQNAVRVMKNRHAELVAERETCHPTLSELMPLISGKLGRKLLETGEMDEGLLAMGQCVGLLRQEESVNHVLEEMECEYRNTLSRLTRQ